MIHYLLKSKVSASLTVTTTVREYLMSLFSVQRDSNGALLEDGDSESSSDEDEEMGEGNSSHQAKQVMQQGPVIDDDGFQLVQTKGRKR